MYVISCVYMYTYARLAFDLLSQLFLLNFQRNISENVLFCYLYDYIIPFMMIFEAAKPKIFTIL